MIRGRYEILLVDSETGATTVHSRKRTRRSAIESAEELNLDLYFKNVERLGKHYTDTLYFSVRDSKRVN